MGGSGWKVTVGGVKSQGDPIVVNVVVNTPECSQKTPPVQLWQISARIVF